LKSSAYGNTRLFFPLEEPPERPPLEFAASAEDHAGSPWSFDRLLGTLSFEAFCTTYWGKYPVLIRGRNPKLFSSLTSLSDIESYFSLPGILDDHVFLRSRQAPGQGKFKSIPEMYSGMRAGASLHLPDVEQFLAPEAPLRHLYRNTIERLQHPGHSIHCFISPPGRECLGTHYDQNEIFTLQISGSKRWKLFHRVVAVEPAGCPPDQLAEPIAEFSLGPGDMLYHPRGQVHEVMSEDSVSCSVALVIAPLTWRELLSFIADDLGNTREFMEQLPAGLSWNNGASTQIAEEMESRLRIIAGKLPALTAGDLVNKIADDFVKRLAPPPRPRLEGLLQPGEVTLATQVQMQSNLAYRISCQDGKVLVLLAGGETIRMPLKLHPVLVDLMQRRGIFPVADLHPRLTGNSKAILAKKLIEYGVLTVMGHVERNGDTKL
jgi:hypothetical protein